MKHTHFFAIAFLFLLSACITTTSNTGLPTSVVLPNIGQKFFESIEISGKQFPLPEGNFEVAGTDLSITGKNGYATSIFLVNHRNGHIQRAVEIYTNLSIKRSDGPSALGWATHRSCIRDDMHFRETIKNERLGYQDCWWVNHWRMIRTGNRQTEHWKETIDFLKKNQLSAPLEMIAVSYRIANKTDYATINYFFNPVSAGFPAVIDDKWETGTWSDSPWRPDNVKKNSARSKYINSLISWGKSWHKQITHILTKTRP